MNRELNDLADRSSLVGRSAKSSLTTGLIAKAVKLVSKFVGDDVGDELVKIAITGLVIAVVFGFIIVGFSKLVDERTDRIIKDNDKPVTNRLVIYR